MYHTNILTIKTTLFIIISFFSCQSTGFAMDSTDESKIFGNSEQKITKNMLFSGTSMPELYWWKALWPDPKNVVLSLGIEPSMVVIDLCCGYGYFTPILAQSCLKIYGLELDGELLEKARRKAEHQNIKNCFWIQGDAMELNKLILEKVDFILLANTFHGVQNKEALGKSMFSALKPQGKLVVVNWHKREKEETTLFGFPTGPQSEMRIAPSEVQDILCPLGFTFNTVIELPPYHYGVVFTK
jgi:SAM-dependent methyltransferase